MAKLLSFAVELIIFCVAASQEGWTFSQIFEVIGWGFALYTVMLVVPLLVVTGPLRKTRWLVWCVLVEAFLTTYALFPEFDMSPSVTLNVAGSVMLVVLASLWYRKAQS